MKPENRISSTDALKMLEANPSIVVVDVRTPAEYAQGHIKGAVNVEVTGSSFPENIQKIQDPNKIYLVHCLTNQRSSAALRYMLANGFSLDNTYQMTDGFWGWQSNGLPIER